MKHFSLKYCLTILIASTLTPLAIFGSDGKNIDLIPEPIDNVDKYPFNTVGLIEGQGRFTTGCLIGSQRTVITTEQQLLRTKHPDYYWYGKWNEGEVSPYKRKDVRIPLRALWRFTNARGYAMFHKEFLGLPKAGDDLALLQSYEDLGGPRDVAEPPKTKYIPHKGQTILIGYPQGGPGNNTLKTMSPLLRAMQQTSLGTAPLIPKYPNRYNPWIELTTNSETFFAHDFLGNEGGPVFIQTEDDSWQLIAILARVSEVKTNRLQEGLWFHILDETTFKYFIEPALPKD
ncbi:MAG: hypothetical protein Tsb0018_10220 [Opitutales bacterium]